MATTTTQVTPKNKLEETDEYRTLKDAYVGSQSQLNQAQQQAMKYADITRQAQGIATQGSAIQQQANMSNAYINAQNSLNQSYMNNLNTLQNTKSNEAVENITTLLNEDGYEKSRNYIETLKGYLSPQDRELVDYKLKDYEGKYNAGIDYNEQPVQFKNKMVQTLLTAMQNEEGFTNGKVVKIFGKYYKYYDGQYYPTNDTTNAEELMEK